MLLTDTHNNNVFVGKSYSGFSVYPDLLNEKYFIFLKHFLKNFNNIFDGYWLDMNEMTNFFNGSCHYSN